MQRQRRVGLESIRSAAGSSTTEKMPCSTPRRLQSEATFQPANFSRSKNMRQKARPDVWNSSDGARRIFRPLKVRCPPALPALVRRAAEQEMTTGAEYVRRAVIERLRADGIAPEQHKGRA